MRAIRSSLVMLALVLVLAYATAVQSVSASSEEVQVLSTPGDSQCAPCHTGVLCAFCTKGCHRPNKMGRCVPVAPVFGLSSLGSRGEAAAWTSFKRDHEKEYETHEEEKARFAVFIANRARIAKHNARTDSSYRMAMNQFGDLTSKEFALRASVHTKRAPPRTSHRHRRPEAVFDGSSFTGQAVANASLDWRLLNAVTPVRNQLGCTADYAFAAVAAIEGAHAVKTNRLVSLSEQQLVDCSTAQGNLGCDGGYVDGAFKFTIMNEGLTSNESYPYNALEATCGQGFALAASISSLVQVVNETDLLAAVTNGPVTAYVASSSQAFQFYSLGVLDDPSCGDAIDHAVAIVGYGTDQRTGLPYWIIKNSYGIFWGEKGYARLKRDVNQCGIGVKLSFPVV